MANPPRSTSNPSRVRPSHHMRMRNLLRIPTAIPSLLYASGTWTTTEGMKKKLQTTQRRELRMITQTKREVTESDAAAHAANVDDENAILRTNQKRTRLMSTPEDPFFQQENSHEVASNPYLSSVPQDEKQQKTSQSPGLTTWYAQPTRQRSRRD